ncbi:xanthine dehydrogenase family protein molybdopterin-binding subunit [Plastorhodobacter daqingensis]|uniref:Xanthine dehydrogenase family protein molybdopterin-binding subunit n=1 Tax=Plastorhodobacter daqingensis TaxID=1387281 RepID=A0ABW2UHZ8_9RHOB
MKRHQKIDTPQRDHRLDGMVQGVLGAPLDRIDGSVKVQGLAPYAGEARLPGLAHGVLVRAPQIGRITGMDTDRLQRFPGVLLVLTEGLPRNSAQGTADTAPPSSGDRADYVGQPVALVVAETLEQAQHAALQAEVAIAATGGVTDPEAADTPVETPEKKQLDLGDLDRALAEAAFRLDETYRTPTLSSAPLEPHAAVAHWQDGRLELHGSYQMLKYNVAQLADALDVAPDRIRLLAPFVGGGFGSKLGIGAEAVGAALAARKLDRPVSVRLHRRQVFEMTSRRSETRQRIRLAADRDGKLTGIGHDSLVSNLPGEAFSEPVAQGTRFNYAAPNRRILHQIARVGRISAGSVRAPGEAVGVTAFETAMDELALQIGLDPVELRLRNMPDCDPVSGKPFSSHMLAEALREGAGRFGWQHRPPRSRREGEWWIGMGMASAVRVNMLMESEARVTLSPAGEALVETDMTDIGTGSYTILAQIAAEMLGLPMARVSTRLGDTDLPPAAGSGGSFGASSSGSAVYLACLELRSRIARSLGCAETDLTLKDGDAIHANHRTPLAEILAGESWSAVGHVEPGQTAKDVRAGTYGVNFAEVAVNDVTGETRLRRMEGVFACGRILNEKTARSQCHGGMIWGIGMALTEALLHDPRDGHAVNRDLAEYHLPVNRDTPAIGVHFLDERDDWVGPLQSKGIGELAICGAGAAVVNAIHNACGVRIRDYPATPDKVLLGLLALEDDAAVS